MRKRIVGGCLLLIIVASYLPIPTNAAETGWWWPCPSNLSISSYYGMRTYNGVTRLHRGVDIPGARGAEVIASKSGIARIAHPNNPFYDDRGRCIVIDHEDGYYSVYQHLSGYAIGDNVRVTQGQVIGYVGGSGSSGEYAYGAHLHFEIHKYYTNNALTILNLDWSKGQNTAVTSINPYPTYITPDNPRPSDTTPPSNPKPASPVLSTASSTYKASQSITLSWNSVANTTLYWLHIYDKNGKDYINKSVGTATSYTATYPAGKYTAYIAACNSAGEGISTGITFYVYNSLPTKPTISGSKSIYTAEENFTIKWNNNGTAHTYWLHIYDKDGRDYKNESLGSATSYSHNFPVGKYRIYITACNPYGETTANAINITVGTYRISYNANGGTGAPSAQTKIYGNTLTLSGTKPICLGSIFKNWNTKQNGTGISYNPGDIYTANEPLTLYAQWEKLAPVLEAAVRKSGNTHTVETELQNIPETCEVMVMGYKNGRLIAFDSKNNVQQNESFTLTGDIDVIKVMAWDSLSSLSPLCEAAIIPASEWLRE